MEGFCKIERMEEFLEYQCSESYVCQLSQWNGNNLLLSTGLEILEEGLVRQITV